LIARGRPTGGVPEPERPIEIATMRTASALPPAPAGAARLVQLTDPHASHHPQGEFFGVDTLASLEAVIGALNRAAPYAAVVVSGDLVSEESARAYRSLQSLLRRIPAPVYCMAGNHDDVALMAAHLPGGNIRLDREFDLQGWRIVLLDTRVAGSPAGCVARTELERLGRALGEHEDGPALVFLHHQPIPVGSPWIDAMMVENADELFGALAPHRNVRALVCGHIHQAFTGVRAGIAVLGTPSTCAQFVPNHDRYAIDACPPGFRWFDLHADGHYDTGVLRLAHVAPTIAGDGARAS
jgi:Icc protein